MNEIEGKQITGKTEPEEILKVMRERYPEAGVVLTLGSDGSVCQDREELAKQEIFPVKAVDTTATGDTFTGYFIAARVGGKSVKEGLRRASIASALAVSREGAVPSIPTKEEVDQAERRDFV